VDAVSRAADLRALGEAVSACERCRLAAGRTQAVFGSGHPDADLLFVGEAPGFHEDQQGVPFVGQAGKLLEKLLAGIGLTRGDVYIANVLKCRPPGNRDPLPEEVASCRPWLERQIELIAPRVIVTLGNFAARLLLDTTAGIKTLRGRAYPYGTAVVVPTYHPSFVLRSGSAGEPMAGIRADLVRAKEHLAVPV
jgi:uracil-DNA glycosylase family 4